MASMLDCKGWYFELLCMETYTVLCIPMECLHGDVGYVL